MKVLFLPEVSSQFLDLIEVLYDKGYVNFFDEAVDYSETLFRDIQTSLALRPHLPAPEYFSSYGKDLLYAAFIKNRNTTWYVFFNVYENDGETIYLVRFISNNHVIAKYLSPC
ncbi:MAG: hypothetical protein IK103_02280 [Bacteroidales bacterium]|nr:hypothetical protein [Bacteroidales bacterium]